jgi:hypothetical protein
MINNDSKSHEKFRIRAGIIAMMGITRLAMYKLLGQSRPLARFENALTFPSRVIFLDNKFKPEMQSELLNL